LLAGDEDNFAKDVPGCADGGPLGMTDAANPIIYLPEDYVSDSPIYGYTRRKGQSFGSLGINDGVTWTLKISGVGGGAPQVLTFRTGKNNAPSACTPPVDPPPQCPASLLQVIIDFILLFPRFFVGLLNFILQFLGLGG